ncbi:MAG: anti-sigma factor family protein [Leptolyngbyaceae cyanobacterium]
MSQYRDLDATKRDRFELLSAYLDGEVSPEERRLVSIWLDQDPETQCLYRRLLQLRQGFQKLPYEQWQVADTCETAQQVFRKLNRRLRMSYMAGMTAAAVVVVGIFSGALHPIERISGGTTAATPSEDNLEIALDQSPIAIPKPATTSSGFSADSLPESATPSALNETAL